MTHAIGVRAASFATSAALLGIVVIGAFSISITLQPNTSDPPLSFPIFQLPPDPPPPVTPRETPPPSRPVTDEPTVLDIVDPSPQPPLPDYTGQTVSQPPIGPPVITNPRWLRTPRDLERYYPARALARDIGGQVVLDCLVDVAGALNCAVVSETPANWGFGDAALRISRDYRMAPAMRDGQAVQGRYRMRVPFEVR